MLIIKPYGRTRTSDESGTRRRTLTLTPKPDQPSTEQIIPHFAATDPELVMAQWIAMIDKIARKPEQDKDKKKSKLPTVEQRKFRELLGNAAWDKASLPEELKATWAAKIHPYGDGVYKPKTQPNLKGRWYERFVGAVEPGKVDADRAKLVADKIKYHLLDGAYHLKKESLAKKASLVTARAESIEKNVHKEPEKKLLNAVAWSDADKETYFKSDIAAEIYKCVKDKQSINNSRGEIAALFFEHYTSLFTKNDKVLPRAEADKNLLALHDAAKRTYKDIFERQKLKHKHFPEDKHALLYLMAQKYGNRQLAALVRLGKVIHYEAADAGTLDSPKNVTTDWPCDITNSAYWTSDGQTDIKRNEAMVRVWRSVIALGSRTLKDWADPADVIDYDILTGNPTVNKIWLAKFDCTKFDAKTALLFGDRSDLFTPDNKEEKIALLKLAIDGWKGLRNNSFHFKGRAGFIKALQKNTSTQGNEAENLWTQDTAARTKRLKETLEATFVDKYLTPKQLAQLFTAIEINKPDHSPLPRFRRVLTQINNSWNAKSSPSPLEGEGRGEGAKNPKQFANFPAVPNQNDLQAFPALLCQYTCLQMLYDRAFPHWLDKATTDKLNEWIKNSNDRATEAAKTKNGSKQKIDPVARAAQFGQLDEGETFAKFVDRLTGATATEFRVQRGYDSHAENAQKQAVFLNKLRMDVTAQAFAAYLAEHNFSWVLDLEPNMAETQSLSDFNQLTATTNSIEAAPWQQILYFLIHLVPVDDISKLLHQLRKWDVLEKKGTTLIGETETTINDVMDVFALYLDMHDAKADGGTKILVPDDFKSLFDNAPADNFQVPARGLREMLRFGNLAPLQSVFALHKITNADVKALDDADITIEDTQNRREELHAKWVKQKDEFSADNKNDYVSALKALTDHRHLANHVRLTNHVRLHRLLMQVLGRLVDYSGLWERDVYFVALALVHLEGKKLEDIFNEEGFKALKNGQIVKAINNMSDVSLKQKLISFFVKDFAKDFDGCKTIRNDLAHFNMLKVANLPVNLTVQINHTRTLMSYDRKLKNAISISIIELLARENIDLEWGMDNHQLQKAVVKTRQATHLGEDSGITENLHGDQLVNMVASLFAGTAKQPDPPKSKIVRPKSHKKTQKKHDNRVK
jgi:hypothetical protein